MTDELQGLSAFLRAQAYGLQCDVVIPTSTAPNYNPHTLQITCLVQWATAVDELQAARATPADQEPALGKDVWEYSFVHSSALGRPDEKVTMLTYEKENAFKPECFDQKLVCSVGMFVAEVSQDSDGFKHIADVVELDDIPAGTRLYAIAAGNVAAPQPEAQSVRDAALDSSRLDYLDKRNARKNEQYGTKYGWQLNENHNRIALEDHAWPGASVRAAIDQAMKETPL